MENPVYILSAVRTPIGKFGGMLADFTAPDLGVIAVRAALERAFGQPLPSERTPGKAAPSDQSAVTWRVDELIFGNARPAGVGPNPARQIAWRSGLGDDVPAFTVNMACASGLRAVVLGWQQIRLGEAGIIVAGGTESMSRVPYLVEGRWGFKMGNQPLVDAMYRDGFMCPISRMIMGETAELLAEQYAISREEQDAFALESQRRAARASAECRFKAEIVPVEKKDKKGNVARLEKDEHIRADATLQSLAKLPPVFSKAGSITAGNSSGITDGAAAVILASERRVRELKLKPLARIVDATIAAVDPRVMGIGPVPAIRALAERTGTQVANYDAVELNEAFAAQVIACDRELHFDRAKLNPNGGAIALGHPIGCTGARILTTLLHELTSNAAQSDRSVSGRRGLATLCVSGGMGVAVEIETV
ncbi:MAG TPA: thiolase family protein [Candidatus Acidoferrales bacterium]|nr:thiolase family protein [Candidatus Acidoferrales bacterium]